MSNTQEKKQSIWLKMGIKSGLLIDDSEETVAEATQNLITPPNQKVAPTTLTGFTKTSSLLVAADVISSNADMKASIMALIKETNLNKNDFYEFMLMLDALKGVPTMEIRYSSAFAALSIDGMTLDYLLQTATTYKDVVAKDQQDFDAHFESMYKTQVAEKNQIISEKAQEMQALSEKINQLQADISLLGSEVNDSEAKLAMSKTQYKGAGDSVITDIDSIVNNIKLYVKP